MLESNLGSMSLGIGGFEGKKKKKKNEIRSSGFGEFGYWGLKEKKIKNKK